MAELPGRKAVKEFVLSGFRSFKKEPDMNCAPAPTFLANSTLETYSQGTDPLASSSCMACHGNAVSQQVRPPDMKAEEFFNQSDFTFMLEKARGKPTQ